MNAIVDDTKARLLDAAGAEFAEKGYQGATIRGIIQRAGANIAAVHYHFGDKEQLYVQAVLEAHRRCTRGWPAGSGAGTEPAEALREHVRSLLTNVLGVDRPDDWPHVLILREMVRPTAASDALVREVIRPKFEQLAAVVRRLRPDLEGRRLHATVFSIVAQCTYYRFCRPIAQRLVGMEAFSELDLDFLTDHITAFALRALSDGKGAAR